MNKSSTKVIIRNIPYLLLILFISCTIMLPATSLSAKRIQSTTTNQLLWPGTFIRVIVPDIFDQRLVVDEAGYLLIGEYGRVDVGGLTLKNAKHSIEKLLKPYLKQVQSVKLIVLQRGKGVIITGDVGAPGIYAFSNTDTIWTMLGRAGGPLGSSDIQRVVIIRKNKEIRVNLSNYLSRRDTSPLPTIQSGDTIFIPSQAGSLGAGNGAPSFLTARLLKQKIFVMGAVNQSGLFDRTPDMTVVKTILLAGGPSGNANLAAVQIISAKTRKTVDARQWFQTGKGDLPLPNDTSGLILWIPPTVSNDVLGFPSHINIVGSGGGGSQMPVRGPTGLVDILTKSGTGDSKLLYVMRADGPYTMVLKYDVAGLFKHGGIMTQIKLLPGDTLYTEAPINVRQVIHEWVGIIGDLMWLGYLSDMITNGGSYYSGKSMR